jgi:hypothetical protein
MKDKCNMSFFFLMVLTKGKETNMTAQKQDIVFKFN